MRVMKYLNDTREENLSLSTDGLRVVKWYVDASFAVHPDFKSHNGAMMTLGKGVMQSIARKQKMKVRSSTECKLVAVDDAATMILWTKLFLEAQGYDMDKNIVYQDHKSPILLETNGKKSLGKRTRSLNIHSTSLEPIRWRREMCRLSTAGLTTWSEIFLQSLCKARSSKDFRMISLEANAAYQDTRKTWHDVTQDKEQFEEHKI
jgi:hypothetical protein